MQYDQTPQQPYQTPLSYPQQPYYQPSMPSQQKSKAGWLWGWILVLLAASVFSCTIGYAAGSRTAGVTTPASTDTNFSVSTQAPTSQNTNDTSIYNVGQKAIADSKWEVTITGTKTEQESEFQKPASGHRFLLISVLLKNISSETLSASSLMQWDLRDLTGQKYTEKLVTDSNSTPPDGKVQPGDPLKGVLSYEVPTDTKKFRLGYITSITDNSITTFEISL